MFEPKKHTSWPPTLSWIFWNIFCSFRFLYFFFHNTWFNFFSRLLELNKCILHDFETSRLHKSLKSIKKFKMIQIKHLTKPRKPCSGFEIHSFKTYSRSKNQNIFYSKAWICLCHLILSLFILTLVCKKNITKIRDEA